MVADALMPQVSAPPAEQENPYLPPGPGPIVFDTFLGINTNASRPGIDDREMYWCDGFMPLGKNNLRVLPGIGSKIYTSPTINGVVFFDFYNIGATPYMFVLLVDGSMQQVNTNTNVVTQIAPPGTIVNPNRANVGISQWGNQYLLVVANQPNGYWVWDGANLFDAGTLGPDVNLVNDGLDYTSPPNITPYNAAGPTSGSFAATIQDGVVQSVSVTNPGSGFLITDAVVLAFSGGAAGGATAVGYGIASGGTISGISLFSGGAGYTSSATATLLGGGGEGAEVSVVASGGAIVSDTVTAPGSGYVANPVLFVIDPNNPIAQASVDTFPFGVQGTAIETYQSRVWITNGPIVQFTAPDSIVDFSAAGGGNTFRSSDSFLRVGFTQPRQTNGFLYLIADSSINYISGVQTSGSPPSTTFTNQNADPEIGTPYAATIDVFSRNILFGNAWGAHVSYGGAVTKISEALDGVYNTVLNFGGFSLSAAKAIIFGKRVWMILVPVIDLVTNQQVNKLFIWNGKTWFSSQQDVNLVYVQHQEINSVITAYGTDGTSIYPLFQQPSIAFTKRIQSKLWDLPGGTAMAKATNRLWGLAVLYSLLSATLDISVDNENSQSEIAISLGLGNMNWTTDGITPMTWTTNGTTPMNWTASGAGIIVFPPTAVAQQGVLLGLTITTNAADLALVSLTIAPEIVGYRG